LILSHCYTPLTYTVRYVPIVISSDMIMFIFVHTYFVVDSVFKTMFFNMSKSRALITSTVLTSSFYKSRYIGTRPFIDVLLFCIHSHLSLFKSRFQLLGTLLLCVYIGLVLYCLTEWTLSIRYDIDNRTWLDKIYWFKSKW